MSHRLAEAIERLGSPHVSVIGDVMLDAYIWGSVERISPEAPIPVVRVRSREERPGGAGNVANMLAKLRARVRCVGVVGDDRAGQTCRSLLEAAGVDCAAVRTVPGRQSTIKTRVMGSVLSAGRAVQQIVRIDEEQTDEVPADCQNVLFSDLAGGLAATDLVLVQDMAKGVLSAPLLRRVIDAAAAAGKPIVVDPAHGRPIEQYRGADVIIPNRREASAVTGERLDSSESLHRAAETIFKTAACRSVIIKLDKDGMYCRSSDGREMLVPTETRQVADVTGAGDMVASVVAIVLASGGEIEDAVRLANVAAGIEVSRVGAAAITRSELAEKIRAIADPASAKIKTVDELLPILDQLRRDGAVIVFTNGCFDLLHVGHVELLKFAGSSGDALVVGLNTDRSIRELKGPGRPVNSEMVRARILAALEDVDYVVLFDEASVEPLIRKLRPDILVKGGQYRLEEVVGYQFVQSYGGRVLRAPHVEGFSTTDIIHKIEGNQG